MSQVDVSVLVPVLNEARHIRETAKAMLSQSFDGSMELLFVDGGSTDGTREILEDIARADGRVRLLDNPAQTTPSALNIGLDAARGEFIARMDAHSRFPPDYVARGVARLRRGDVAWVAGPAIPEGRGAWSRVVAHALATPFLGQGSSRKWGAGAGETELDTGVFAGVWRRATLERLGGWDEGWPVNQDSEMAARVLAAGGRIVCLGELGAHYAPRDTPGRLARQYWRFGYYRAKTALYHPDSLRPSHLLPLVPALAALATPLPGAGGRTARRMFAVYCFGLAASTLAVRRRLPLIERAALPLAFEIMHLSWGGGFIAGSARWALPSRRWGKPPTRARRGPCAGVAAPGNRVD